MNIPEGFRNSVVASYLFNGNLVVAVRADGSVWASYLEHKSTPSLRGWFKMGEVPE